MSQGVFPRQPAPRQDCLLRAAGQGHPQLHATELVRRAALSVAAAPLLRVRCPQTRRKVTVLTVAVPCRSPTWDLGGCELWEGPLCAAAACGVAAGFPSRPLARPVLTTIESSGPILVGLSLLLTKPNAMGTVVQTRMRSELHPGRPHWPSVWAATGHRAPRVRPSSPQAGVGSRARLAASPSPGVDVPSIPTTRLRQQPAAPDRPPPCGAAPWAVCAGGQRASVLSAVTPALSGAHRTHSERQPLFGRTRRQLCTQPLRSRGRARADVCAGRRARRRASVSCAPVFPEAVQRFSDSV